MPRSKEKLAQEEKEIAYDYLLKRAEMGEPQTRGRGGRHPLVRGPLVCPIPAVRAIEATERLAASPNAKILVMG
jgi:hypothetical protein